MRNAALLVALLVVIVVVGCPKSSKEQAADKAAYDMDIKALKEGAAIWTGFDSSGLMLWKVELQVATLPETLSEGNFLATATSVAVRAVFTQLTGETNWHMGMSNSKAESVCFEFDSLTSSGAEVRSQCDIPVTFSWMAPGGRTMAPSGRTRNFRLAESEVAAKEYPAPVAPKTEPLPASKAEKEH